MASSKKSKPKKQAKRIGVALSGGLDSVVLLDAVCKSYPKDVIYALHVHHGLQAKADAWLLFCEQLAKRYKINFDFRLLHLNTKSNIEAQARQARYEALDAMCAQHQLEHLLLAHHQNDQAETVLLQLLRGAGVAGLAAMPAHKEQIITNQTSKQPSKQKTKQAKPQHTIQIWRPLLEQNRKQLEAYAKQQRLNWIEDPSNQDTRYRRNAIRKKILPELEQMQEGAITNLARSAQWLAQAQTLLDQLAKEDAKSITSNHHLKITALQTLKASDPARANNLLRYWIKQQQLGMPSNERLQAWWRDLETLRRDAKLEWSHDGVKIRAWRDTLQIERTNLNTHKANQTNPATKQTTGEWIFVPIAQNSTQAGLPEQWLKSATIETRARSGGERLKIKPNTPSKSLKNLYQEAGVPPWQRQIPLLFINDELIAVEGLGVSITHLSTQGKRLWPEWVYSSKS